MTGPRATTVNMNRTIQFDAAVIHIKQVVSYACDMISRDNLYIQKECSCQQAIDGISMA